jgi:hypothetical protein
MSPIRHEGLDCGPGRAVEGALNLIDGKWKAPAPETELPFPAGAPGGAAHGRNQTNPMAPVTRHNVQQVATMPRSIAEIVIYILWNVWLLYLDCLRTEREGHQVARIDHFERRP